MFIFYTFLLANCDIDVIDASKVNIHELKLNFPHPVKITNMLDWKAFLEWDTSEKFSNKYGSYMVNANRTSYAYGKDHTSIQEFMKYSHREHIIVMDDTRITSKENELLNTIFDDFHIPTLFENVTYSRVLSLGGGIRGVDMMKHCVAWIGMIAGKKRWYLSDPKHQNVNSNCFQKNTDARIQECIIEKGDIMYVPNFWWHATCNLEPYTVAVGTQCEGSYNTNHKWKANKDEM